MEQGLLELLDGALVLFYSEVELPLELFDLLLVVYFEVFVPL